MSSEAAGEPVAKAPLIGGQRGLLYPLLASAMAVFAVQLDFFSVQAAIPQMADDLGTTASALQWVMSAYFLGVASFLIVGGRLGDIFGRRRWLLIGAAVFALTSITGAAAGSEEVLIVSRFFQGVGGAIMMPVGLAVTTNAFPAAKVQRAIGLVLGIGAIGQAFGPLIGGLLTDTLSWRSVLAINVPVALLVIFFAWRGVQESRDTSVPKSIDWAGVALIAGSAGVLMLGIDQSAVWGWADPRTVSLIVLGLVGLGVFAVVESRVRFPLLDLNLFKNRVYTAVTVGGALGTTSTTIVIFLAMIFFQDIQGLSAIEAGTAFLTFSIGYAIAALASGRFEAFQPWVVMTSALLVGGVGAIGLGLSGSLASFVVVGLVAGLGLGLAFNYLNVVSQAVVPARLAGAASGTALTMLVFSAGIALALAVSLFDIGVAQTDLGRAEVIDVIFIGAGCVSILSALLVAALGRGHPSQGPADAG